ncbi:hypothetical protein BDW68DRAFT_190704 [Aspergillus falconensis]
MLRSTPEPAFLARTAATGSSENYNCSSRPSRPPLASSVDSGKPHNVICSKCRGPNNLIFCETCCRSYHGSCLPASACVAGRWGHVPPMLDQLTSPTASRSATPFVRPATSGIISPAAETARGGMQTPFRVTDHIAAPDAFDPSILSRARDFLRTHGAFPESQEFSMDLLLKLGAMMTELDFHRSQVQELASENAHLRQDNANIRAYLDSNLRTGKPFGPGGDFSEISRPSADTTGKSWDRIVMDLI